MFVNKAIIVGNLTKDPELKSLPSGSKVCNFSIATNRKWKTKEGLIQEDVEFHNIVVFGKQAENVAKYMTKGSQLYVEGRIQTRSWEDKNGTKRYTTEIIAEMTQFGAKRSESTNTTSKPQKSQETQESSDVEYPEDEINPDDIPF
jgi:single-strand DNA-binding protein